MSSQAQASDPRMKGRGGGSGSPCSFAMTIPGEQLRAEGRLSSPLAPMTALALREDVFDLPNDSGAVERTVDSRGVDEGALSRLQDRLDVVDGEDILLNQNVERRHCNGSADHGRPERAAGEGRVRHA